MQLKANWTEECNGKNLCRKYNQFLNALIMDIYCVGGSLAASFDLGRVGNLKACTRHAVPAVIVTVFVQN